MPAPQEFGPNPIDNPDAPVKPTLPAITHGKDGRLSYASMREVISRGGGVAYKGRIIAAHADLPSEVDYAAAGGDTSEVDRVRQEKQAEIDRLQSELNASRTAASGSTGADEPTFADHPLSDFDGMSDEQILAMDGIGARTFDKIKAAQAERDAAARSAPANPPK